ncbi:protein asteroid-like [Sitophilus oryzae]|uniref:Protein asteroid-like n=1 Tax=Sitophilus oryzae TaxID=7048 RepID=A0A6J2YDK8_SITOR|nr:protein asteroid-like [Sitophilus oryzae]
MGVRGLTTFINNRSHLYLKEYKLHDCKVVLDGNSIASNLYKWHCKCNDCFGGDYDKFANVIYSFFDLLRQCNITPYVIFDGGYEKRKLATVISRMKNKIMAANHLSSATEGSESVFPLFLREVFLDVVLELGIKTARCEFEGDMEISKIAKVLDCPVLSYDSDFYIFGCLYIPFSTVELVAKKGNDLTNKKSFLYIPCKIYNIESFLKSYGGLDRSNLPLLAVILGNDYVKGTLFNPFLRNLKIQKCTANQSDQQKRIKSLIYWLQNETVETAIKTVLSRFKSCKRQYILKKIKEAMKGYYEVNSELLEYLGIKVEIEKDSLQLEFTEIERKLENYYFNPKDEDESDDAVEDTEDRESETENIEDKDESVSDNAGEDSEDCEERQSETEDIENKNKEDLIYNIFLQNFQKCQYPSSFMDMIVQNKYYCIPQVEDAKSEHSHVFSLDILSFIYQVLTPTHFKSLIVVSRCGRTGIRYSKLPQSSENLYTFEDIQVRNLSERKQILFEVLKIDPLNLDKLPTEWHLFLVSLQYALQKGSFDKALIISLILCFYVLNYIDTVLGFSRSTKTFEKKFNNYKNSNINKNEIIKNDDTSLQDISLKDCMFFMNKVISYFQMDLKLKTNYRLYDKTLVHSMSQLQSIFLHVKYLNSLLNLPFENLKIHKIFDGTFVYNMTNNLRKRTNIENYLEQFLNDCPGILNKIKFILNRIEYLFTSSNLEVIQKLKRKKRKKQVKHIGEETACIEENEESDEGFIDPNNLYSLLNNS